MNQRFQQYLTTTSCLKVITNPDTKLILPLDKSDMLKAHMETMIAFMEKTRKLFKQCGSITSLIKGVTNLKMIEI